MFQVFSSPKIILSDSPAQMSKKNAMESSLPGKNPTWNILKMAEFPDGKAWFWSLLGDANGVPLLISYLILQQSNEWDKQWIWMKEDQDRSKSKCFEISPAPSPGKKKHTSGVTWKTWGMFGIVFLLVHIFYLKWWSFSIGPRHPPTKQNRRLVMMKQQKRLCWCLNLPFHSN